MANLRPKLSALHQTYSTFDLTSPTSIHLVRRESTSSLNGKWGPLNINPATIPDESIVDPKANLELTYPLLHKFVNNQLEWDAPLQMLKLTLQIINDKRVFRKKTDAAQFEDLKQLYRNWWQLIRNNPSLQSTNIRKLSKCIKDFIVAALEDASYAVKMTVLGTEKSARMSVRESTAGSWKIDVEKKSVQRLSSQFSHVPATSIDASGKTDVAIKPSHSRTINILDLKATKTRSKVAPQMSQMQISSAEMSTDLFATAIKSMVNEDEMYMQIIVKDILSDISAREAERQKKLQHASDEAARGGHRSSATTGDHPRIPFGSKRMSGKTIKSRIPLHSIMTTKIVGSVVDAKQVTRHNTGVGLRNLLEASHLRNELKEKIENIKLRNDRQDIQIDDGVKSIKDKVHLKIRADGNLQVQNYVRPLGKK